MFIDFENGLQLRHYGFLGLQLWKNENGLQLRHYGFLSLVFNFGKNVG
jgi:hypothetical protein